MSQFSHLLQRAAAEVRSYSETSPDAKNFDRSWLVSLAQQMDAASGLASDADVEHEIDAIAYAITDSGPLTAEFAPSFRQALDALQRRRKREQRR